MTRYLAFLRGINVGGKHPVKMADLRTFLTALEMREVQTHIQTGNIAFNHFPEDIHKLADRIKRGLFTQLGFTVPVIVRERADVERIIAGNPFQARSDDGDLKFYICFLDWPPQSFPVLPLKVEKEGLELIGVDERTAYVVSYPVGGGRYGYPNNFVEKRLGTTATSRYWKTLLKMIEKTA